MKGGSDGKKERMRTEKGGGRQSKGEIILGRETKIKHINYSREQISVPQTFKTSGKAVGKGVRLAALLSTLTKYYVGVGVGVRGSRARA